MNLCACGCGKLAKEGNRYINGHNKSTLGLTSKFKGKSYVERFGEEKADEIFNKIRISKLGDNNPARRPDVRNKISRNRKGLLCGKNNPNYWLGRKNNEQSKRMKINNPAHRLDVKEKSRKRILEKWKECGNVKIGVNEKRLLDYIESIINYKIIRQYSINGYAVDGYVQELNLVIEIDEKHHYSGDGKLREKDIKRQNQITETIKCEFIRVRDDISDINIKDMFCNKFG